MDSDRFDSLARSLLAGLNRRTLLGAAFAGVLGIIRDGTIEAKNKKKKCPPCKKRKKGKCKGKKPDGMACRGGSCQNGRCVSGCPNGATSCGGVCANLQSDEANCGSCGTSCAANEVCQTGRCFPRGICPSFTQICTGAQHSCAATCKCASSVEGNTLCVQNEPFCSAPLPFCQTSANCAPGKACIDVSGCCSNPKLPAGSRVCLAPCAAPAVPQPPPPPQDCTTAATCPQPSLPCAEATCVEGKCDIGPKAANTVCRPAVGQCDVAEVCNGGALICPANQFKPSNTPCGTEQICCSGTCCIAGEACGSRGTCCRGLLKSCTSNSECCSNNCSGGICLS
jgi:hypothetical protein